MKYYEMINGKRIVDIYDDRPDGSVLIRLEDKTEIVIYHAIIRDDLKLIKIKSEE